MRQLTILALILLIPLGAAAGKWGFEPTPFVAFDAKAVVGQPQGNDILVGARFRHNRSLLALEFSANLDHGVGAMILLDTIRVWRLRVHLDLGIFYPAWEQMSVPEVPRSYDIVIGAGVEVAFYKKRLAVILNWRAYLPDPRLIGYYGDFYIPIYKRVLKEAPWWLGLGWRF